MAFVIPRLRRTERAQDRIGSRVVGVDPGAGSAAGGERRRERSKQRGEADRRRARFQ
jgi:hypothetical protein